MSEKKRRCIIKVVKWDSFVAKILAERSEKAMDLNICIKSDIGLFDFLNHWRLRGLLKVARTQTKPQKPPFFHVEFYPLSCGCPKRDAGGSCY